MRRKRPRKSKKKRLNFKGRFNRLQMPLKKQKRKKRRQKGG